MTIIYKPTQSPDCWREFLADPETQWKTGYSAKSMAYAWEQENGMPASIRDAIELALLGKLEPLMVIPEYKVPLPGRGRDSQNDAFVLARIGSQTAAIMVEGKVNESFDVELSDWMKRASDNKKARLTGLCNILGLKYPPDLSLRYQLFHRTASALITAQRFKTDIAIMLVHSFSQDHAWFEDYAAFAKALGINAPKRGTLQKTNSETSLPLYLGWVTGDPKYLKA